MNETELLLTIAEISVAFAGFASLASIFGRRSSLSEGCVFGVPSGRSLAVYIGGLIALLIVSGSLFFSVIESLAYSSE